MNARRRAYAALAHYFPDREFFMRSQGQVRFLRISQRFQITAALAVAGALLLWLLITLGVLANQYLLQSERAALVRQQAAVASSADRVAAYRKSVDAIAADLERRQAFLEGVVTSYIGDASDVAAGNAVVGKPDADAADDSAAEPKTISAIIPEATGLARIEARQLAFVDQLTRAAEARAARAAGAIRKFGLDPDNVARASRSARSAQGGPFIPFAADSARRDRLDPRFAALGQTLARMDALERGLVAIPSGKPAFATPITSSYGYRRDPFTGAAAMHSGIDFRGAYGSPILAAANGKVIYAGIRSGYGNCVEVAHSNGLVTRYAHLSRIVVRPGQRVSRGDRLGGMGSTGRSTGTHLHFEVRMNDHAINPRPFLEANRDVLKIQAVAAERTGHSPARG